jgi:hypothetical protein
VSRGRLAALALLAYPPAVRATCGEEMLSTLHDASVESRRRFAREIVDLVRVGLRARATQTARVGAGRLAADGLCLAATWLMTLYLSTLLAQRARGYDDALLSWPSIALLGGVLAVALIGYDRLAGAGALAWTVLRLPALWDHHPGLVNLVPEVLPILCFTVLLLAPRQRAPDPRRLAWLLVPAILVATLGPSDGDQSPLLLAYVALATILLVLFALAMLPTDPRLALAGAVGLSNLGIDIWGGPTVFVLAPPLMLAATPVVLAVAITRTRRLRRRTPI